MDNRETVKKIQKTVYEILCEIDSFCKEHEIRYFLSGGTCLGAVRHQGFIPWDDDADLMMPRKDYDRFLRLYAEKHSEKYGIGALDLDKNWQKAYARVWDKRTSRKSKYFGQYDMGIYVDIFPIDGLPKTQWGQKIFYTRLKVLTELGKEASRIRFKEENRAGIKILRRLAGLIVKPLGTRYFSKRVNRIAQKYDFDTSAYVACSMPVHYGSRETIEHKHMSAANHLMFGGKEFPVPIGYDTYLRNLYGDYMTIPADAEEKGYSYIDCWDIDFGDE